MPKGLNTRDSAMRGLIRIVSHRYRFYFCVIDSVFVLRTRREGAVTLFAFSQW